MQRKVSNAQPSRISGIRRLIRHPVVFYGCALLLLAGGLSLLYVKLRGAEGPWMLIAFSFYLIWLMLRIRTSPKRIIRKHLASKPGGEFQARSCLSEMTFTNSTDDSTNELAWSLFTRVVVDDGVVLLIDRLGFWLPAADLPAGVTAEEVAGFATARIAEAKD